MPCRSAVLVLTLLALASAPVAGRAAAWDVADSGPSKGRQASDQRCSCRFPTHCAPGAARKSGVKAGKRRGLRAGPSAASAR